MAIAHWRGIVQKETLIHAPAQQDPPSFLHDPIKRTKGRQTFMEREIFLIMAPINMFVVGK